MLGGMRTVSNSNPNVVLGALLDDPQRKVSRFEVEGRGESVTIVRDKLKEASRALRVL